MSAHVLLFLSDDTREWLGLPLVPVVLLLALLLLASPPLSASTPGTSPARRLAVLLIPLGVVAVIALEVFTVLRAWAALPMALALIAAGIALLVRARREAAVQGVVPAAAGTAAVRGHGTAALVGFVAAVAALVAAYFALGGEGVIAISSVQVAGLLAAVVTAGLIADLLPRLRTRTRRAELRPRGWNTVLSRREAVTAAALTAAVTAAAFAVSYGEYLMTKAADCYPARVLAMSVADDTLALGLTGFAAAGAGLLGAVGVSAAAARPAMAPLSPAQDRALRRLSAARALYAAVGAQLVIAGDLLTGAAYALLPVDPGCSAGGTLSLAATAWAPGPYAPGGLLALGGLVLIAAGVLAWLVGTWRATARALTDLESAAVVADATASLGGHR
ncbi:MULTISPECIES: hypothetical protein [unclassified Nocardiopsis]|uniref:hypothetical protein n=1 Tax=Nocardiopsis TaxID=2013 RepID=UPI00387B6487